MNTSTPRFRSFLRGMAVGSPIKVAVLLTVTLSAVAAAAAPPGTVRIAVDKKRVVVGDPPALLFLPISSPSIAAAGFAPLADYATRTVYEGPASAAAGLRSSLAASALASNVASDLENVTFHEFRIDPDSGGVTPSVDTSYTPRGTNGLYFLVLRSYPLATWLDDLDERGVKRLIELPPAGYIVRCPRALVPTLAAQPYVRGVFPMLPAMKTLAFDHPAPSALPYRPVVVEASVESTADSLTAFLQSVSQDGSLSESQAGHVTRYQALLTDLDAENLAQFDLVYEVVALDTPRPSSERQAQLLAQTVPPGSPITLPATNTDYNAFLLSRGIQSTTNTFDNTRVGIMDTGFDTGFLDYNSIHPDFRFLSGGQQITTVMDSISIWDTVNHVFANDRDYHGTLVTSVINGYPGPLPTRAEPANNYRYGLGVAPTVRCVPDKIFQCSAPPDNPPLSIDHEIMLLAENHGVNVVNMSFNDGGLAGNPGDPNVGGGCGYGQGSVDVDSRTRTDGVLSVVAAGNSLEGCPNNGHKPDAGCLSLGQIFAEPAPAP